MGMSRRYQRKHRRRCKALLNNPLSVRKHKRINPKRRGSAYGKM